MVNKPTGSVARWASSYSESFRKTTQQTREEAPGWRDGGGRNPGGQKKTSPCATLAKGQEQCWIVEQCNRKKKETSGSRWWQRDGAGLQSLKSRSKRSACGDLIMKIDFDVEAVNLTIMMIVVIVVFVIIFLHFHWSIICTFKFPSLLHACSTKSLQLHFPFFGSLLQLFSFRSWAKVNG